MKHRRIPNVVVFGLLFGERSGVFLIFGKKIFTEHYQNVTIEHHSSDLGCPVFLFYIKNFSLLCFLFTKFYNSHYGRYTYISMLISITIICYLLNTNAYAMQHSPHHLCLEFRCNIPFNII